MSLLRGCLNLKYIVAKTFWKVLIIPIYIVLEYFQKIIIKSTCIYPRACQQFCVNLKFHITSKPLFSFLLSSPFLFKWLYQVEFDTPLYFITWYVLYPSSINTLLTSNLWAKVGDFFLKDPLVFDFLVLHLWVRIPTLLHRSYFLSSACSYNFWSIRKSSLLVYHVYFKRLHNY